MLELTGSIRVDAAPSDEGPRPSVVTATKYSPGGSNSGPKNGSLEPTEPRFKFST